MRIIKQISENIRDVQALGPAVVLRHFARMRRTRKARINVQGFNPMFVRAGDSDFNAVRQVFVNLEYDLAKIPALKERVNARYNEIIAAGGTPIIADIGANIGVASNWFAGTFPKAKIVSVEPEPGNFAMLSQNMANIPNVTPIEAAIGAEPGFVQLNTQGESWAVTSSRAESGIRIISVDDAQRASGGDTPFIIKIDIEGFESDLFKTNVDWIEKAYVLIVEPYDWMQPGKFLSRSFQHAIAQHEFELFLNGENIIYSRV